MTDRIDRLAKEHEPTASARSVALWLAMAALTVVAANQLAIRLSPAAERTYDGMVVEAKWRLAQQGVAEGGWVVIGDSSGNFAVDAGVMEESIGEPVINLCGYGRFQVSGACWFLDEAMGNGAVPDTVLVVLGSRTFALDPSGDQFAQVPIAPFEWSSRLPESGLDARRSFEFVRSRALPLLDQAQSFSGAALGGRWTVDPSVLVVEANGTSRLPKAFPEGVAPFAERLRGELLAVEGPVPSKRERRAIEALVQAAGERGFRLIFADGPIWDGLVQMEEHSAFLGRIHSFLDEACRDEPAAMRLDVPLQTFPKSELENPFHIVPAASKRFTERLLRDIETLR